MAHLMKQKTGGVSTISLGKHQTGVGKSKLSSKGELKIDLLTQEFSDREPSGTSCSPKPEMARFSQGAARKSKR
jgi:hypothetical protein